MSNIEDDVKILEGKKQCMEGGWESESDDKSTYGK